MTPVLRARSAHARTSSSVGSGNEVAALFIRWASLNGISVSTIPSSAQAWVSMP